MRKYMWPNSCLPSATSLISAAYAASHGRFTLEGVENHAARKYSVTLYYILFTRICKDYPRTLRTWGRRLEQNLRQEVMAQTHPALKDPAEFAAFKRKWEYLFAYAGAGFSKGYITCHMLTFIRAVSSFSFNMVVCLISHFRYIHRTIFLLLVRRSVYDQTMSLDFLTRTYRALVLWIILFINVVQHPSIY